MKLGTWGAGSFENDAATDWAAEVTKLRDIEQKFDQLAALDEDEAAAEDIFVDADLASEVIAAAEFVAVLMNRVAADVPENLRKTVEKFEKPNTDLIEKAKFSVSRVLAESELLDLWSEDDGDPNEWNIAISELIDRLNADVPFDTPPRDDIEKSQGYLTTCTFCDKDIADGEIFQLEFRDLATTDGLYVSRGLYCHLPCLNGALHSKHMIQNWKFNVDQAVVDRLLGKNED